MSNVRIYSRGVPTASRIESVLQPFKLLGRKIGIDAGHADVERCTHSARKQVRTVGGVGREPSAVEGRGGSDAVGIGAGGAQRKTAAHAIPDATNLLGDRGLMVQ